MQIQEWEERGLPLLLRRGQAPAQSCAQQLDILTLGKEQPLRVHLHLHKALMLQVCVSQALAMNLLPDGGTQPPGIHVLVGEKGKDRPVWSQKEASVSRPRWCVYVRGYLSL